MGVPIGRTLALRVFAFARHLRRSLTKHLFCMLRILTKGKWQNGIVNFGLRIFQAADDPIK